MLDIKWIREHLDETRAGLQAKGVEADLDALLSFDTRRREAITGAEGLKQERNAASKEIGRIKKAGGDAAEAMQNVRDIGERIAALDQEAQDAEEKRDALLLALPNLPHDSAPMGEDESANEVRRTVGEPPTFDFKPLPHWELGEQQGWMDFERAARMTGSGFPLLTGGAARLQRALIQFMLDIHVTEHGYREVLPPFLCNTAAMTGTGQLPKMTEDMYRLEGEDLWLIPTAEVPVTNIYREEIIEESLPLALTAYTPCFRREAGAAGRDTRGMIRVHQFDKVEMVRFVEPETSYDELEKLVGHAEDILQRLNLHYRVLELCTGDLSFAAAKCYDLELWAPGYDGWLEVSSCSNFEDFQARRAGIRYRGKDGKPTFVHTLNGSGVALPRLMIALMETYQQADGSVRVPEPLRGYMGGADKI